MAYSYQVPVTYTINVSLAATPQGLGSYNTNSIAIFSNEPANFNENYIAALSPETVKQAFGSNSLTYKMANALFTPPFNFRTGDGYLYVFKYSGVNATEGTITTASLTSSLDNFKAVNNGSLRLTIDNVQTDITGLDFTAVEDLQDIVTVIQSKNPDCDIYITDTDKICFASRRPGSDIAMGVSSTGTDIAGSSYLNSATAETVEGVAASGQSLSDAIDAALQQEYFGGVLTTQYLDATTLLAQAALIEAKDVTFYNELQSLKDITITGAANKTAGDSKTRLLAYSMNKVDAKIAVATYATIAQSVNYNGTDTANTMNLKTLTGVAPDKNLNDTYLLNANTNGVDIYANTGGLACVYSNDNNGYTDDVVNNLRLKKDLEVAGFNYLRQTNTKIPQTEKGLNGLKSAYEVVCKKFVNNGVIAPGAWSGSIPFGNPEKFTDNIAQNGYYIYSIPIAQQPQEEREHRKAPVIQIALKSSGAFHFSNVIVNIQR